MNGKGPGVHELESQNRQVAIRTDSRKARSALNFLSILCMPWMCPFCLSCWVFSTNWPASSHCRWMKCLRFLLPPQLEVEAVTPDAIPACVCATWSWNWSPAPKDCFTPLVWADWYSIFIVSELYINRHATSAKRVAVSLTYVARSLGLLATEQSHWIMITSRREQTHYIIAWISLWSGRDRHGCLLHWFLINYRETS